MDILTDERKMYISLIIVHIIYFVFNVGETMLDVTIRPHILDVFCKQHYSRNVCDHLPNNPDENDAVQSNAGMYLSIYRVLINVPSLFIGVFCGTWSDSYGRKLPMLIPCIGCIAAISVYIVSEPFTRWALVFVLFGAFVQGLCGRTALITIAVNSYTAENTKCDMRTTFLGRLLAMQYFGRCLGALLSGMMDFNIIASFGVMGGLNLIVILLVLFGIKEMPRDKINNTEGIVENPALVNSNRFLKELQALCQIFAKIKSGSERLFIVLIVILSLSNGIEALSQPDLLLFVVTGDLFKWSTAEYSYLFSFEHVALGISLFILVPFFSTFLRLSDFDIMIIGFVCRLIFSICIQFATQVWIICILVFLWSVSGINRNCIRSILSKSVDSNDLGKMFSLLSCVETASKVIGPLIYLNIYSATLIINKWIVFYMMAASGVINVLLVIFVKVRYENLNGGKEFTEVITVDKKSQEETGDNDDDDYDGDNNHKINDKDKLFKTNLNGLNILNGFGKKHDYNTFQK